MKISNLEKQFKDNSYLDIDIVNVEGGEEMHINPFNVTWTALVDDIDGGIEIKVYSIDKIKGSYDVLHPETLEVIKTEDIIVDGENNNGWIVSHRNESNTSSLSVYELSIDVERRTIEVRFN